MVGITLNGAFGRRFKVSGSLLKFLLVFLLMVGKGYSVIVPIEVPPDIPDSLLFDLQKLSKNPQVIERLRQISLKEIRKAFDNGVKDVQPILVRKGKPIEPPRDTFYKPDAFCVRKRLRTCIGGGWTSAEVSRINNHLSRIIPIIEGIYGQAFMTPKIFYTGNPYVKIIKDDDVPSDKGITCAPWYNAVCFVITGEFGCTLWPWDDNGYIVINPEGDTLDDEDDDALLTHELFHAFRLNWILTYPQYEEGHAEAGKILATKELCRIYGIACGFINTNYTNEDTYVFHQYFNLPFIGSNLWWGNFYAFAYEPLWDARYSTWGYLWIKVYLANSNFFLNFNNNLCNIPPTIVRPPYTYDLYLNWLAVPSFGSGPIEGQTFRNWFNNQPAFFNNYPISSRKGRLQYNLAITTYNIPTTTLDLKTFYYRRELIMEKPVDNAVLRMRVWNSSGMLIKDTLLITDSSGVATISLGIGSGGNVLKERFKIQVCDTLFCSPNREDIPIYAEIVLGPIYTNRSINGAVGAEKNIDVHIGSITTRDTNGLFASPYSIRQENIRVYYTSSYLSFMETYWIKDSLPQWIYPGLFNDIPIRRNLRIPPEKVLGITVESLDTINDTVRITWMQNKEFDLHGYEVFRSIDGSDFVFYRFTNDTTILENIGPCVSYKFLVIPVDIWGNRGESSDTVEIFYNDETYDCLFSLQKSEIKSADTGNVKVYDVLGRRVNKKKRGVYFIIKNGKVKKEVIR